MAQEVRLQGRTYSDVPSVLLPDSNNVFHSFIDVTDTTRIASDVASGKYFFTASGTLTLGTASGGGGRGAVTQDANGYLVLDDDAPTPSGGLEYEEGTYSPTEDIARPTILFTDTHTEAPLMVMMTDATGTYNATTNTNYFFEYLYFEKWSGAGLYANTTDPRYGLVRSQFRTTNMTSLSSSTSHLIYLSSDSGDSTTSYPRYWATETGFKPYTGSNSRYWRTGRTYKWIAVWRPTP